jgi:hypothetical protein
VHLLCEFLLGFGGAVLVLEESHHGLSARYDDLASAARNTATPPNAMP